MNNSKCRSHKISLKLNYTNNNKIIGSRIGGKNQYQVLRQSPWRKLVIYMTKKIYNSKTKEQK